MVQKKLLLLLIPLMVWAACSDEDDLGPENEEFRGTYLVRNLGEVKDLAKQDSVTLKIRKNIAFEMHFYGLNGINDHIDFCDASGTIVDFGAQIIGFDPDFVFSGNCDTLRIPRGDFIGDFKTHGDTVYITKNVSVSNGSETIDSIYQLVLLQVE